MARSYRAANERTGRTSVRPVLIPLRGQDLNLRPLGYEPSELTNCSTPRRSSRVTQCLQRPHHGHHGARNSSCCALGRDIRNYWSFDGVSGEQSRGSVQGGIPAGRAGGAHQTRAVLRPGLGEAASSTPRSLPRQRRASACQPRPPRRGRWRRRPTGGRPAPPCSPTVQP